MRKFMTVVEERAMVADANIEAARRAMVDSQLRVSGINDLTILAAFLAVPREDFVPAARRPVAYADRAVTLEDGAVLAPALTYGQMLTAAEPVADDSVLVIGAPGGYLAALAEKLAGNVTLVPVSGDWAAAGAHSLVLIDGAIEDVPRSALTPGEGPWPCTRLVLWLLGLCMGAGSMAGAMIGTRLATRYGARIIRPLLVTASLALTGRLVWGWFAS
jgi:protein-L-isoaspartate(D-aspartate) O-methyltransferase